MNKDLKNIVFEAVAHTNALKPFGTSAWSQICNEKIAELVVVECLKTIADQSTLDVNEDFREGFSHGRKLSWQAIRDKFGVK